MHAHRFIQDKGAIAVMAIFGLVYAGVSLVNHYLFRTYALDLGLFNNAMYDYAHLRWNDSTSVQPMAENLLSDHFDLLLMLLSPLYYVFGSYALLIAQIAGVLLGGLGIFKFCYAQSANARLSRLAMSHFFLIFGVWSAIASDFHSSVIGASLVPWFMLSVWHGRMFRALLVFAVILFARANISLWMLFVCIGLLWLWRRDLKKVGLLAFFGGLSLVYFIVVVGYVIPAISNEDAYAHFTYSALGGTPVEALLYILQHPIEVLRMLFVNHTHDTDGDYIKLELHLFVMFSGGVLLFLRPQYLVMLIPIFFQKLLNDHTQFWGFKAHYAIEFAPILAVGVFDLLNGCGNQRRRMVIYFSVLALTAGVTIRRMDNTRQFDVKGQIRFYQASHYQREYRVATFHKALKEIPRQAVVSAQSPYVPHLAFRDQIYSFPQIENAEYVVFSMHERSYPLNQQDFLSLTDSLLRSPVWQIVYSGESCYILKRQ